MQPLDKKSESVGRGEDDTFSHWLPSPKPVLERLWTWWTWPLPKTAKLARSKQLTWISCLVVYFYKSNWLPPLPTSLLDVVRERHSMNAFANEMSPLNPTLVANASLVTVSAGDPLILCILRHVKSKQMAHSTASKMRDASRRICTHRKTLFPSLVFLLKALQLPMNSTKIH